MKRFQATPASRERYGLGEGPVWDADRKRVLWVDINAGTVHTGTFTGEAVTHATALRIPGTVGAVAVSRSGDLLVAGTRCLYTVTRDGAVSPGRQILAGRTESRLNDGICDPAGRFLVGSLALDHRAAEEVLVRIGADGGIAVIDDDLGMSNGLAFAPDGKKLYSVDTLPGIVWVRDYDPAGEAVGRRHALLQLGDAKPDGLCVDAHGNIWIALWGAGAVRCHAPDGELLAEVDVAAPNTTSVAFVGANLETLLITTASEQLSAAQRARYPESGRLFTADVGVSGLQVSAWDGRSGRAEGHEITTGSARS
jgi:sugar lactone lactonase YvrE